MPSLDHLELTVIGAGYVGLSTAVAFALSGHQVHLVERNPERLNRLLAGKLPFDEPDLAAGLQCCESRLRFTADLPSALETSSLVVLAVGTPPSPAHGADLSQLFAALEEIAPQLSPSCRAVVVKSTVPVGTTAEIASILKRRTPDIETAVVSNPEFLRQGRALRDALFPDRIVVGVRQAWAQALMRQLYQPLREARMRVPPNLEPHRPSGLIPLLELSPESAELAKYAANAFLAMKISFINEIANVCEGTGADVEEIVGVLAADARIGGDFLRAGLGYGGSCFPKDTRALSQIAARSGYEFRLLRAVVDVNTAQRFRALDRLERTLDGLRGKTVCVLGLTFKPDTDDLRESIGVDLALELQARGAIVRAHDPLSAEAARQQLPAAISVSDNLEATLQGADACLLVTEWTAYRDANWTALGRLMRRRTILDGRNALKATQMRAAGFEYLGVGRAGGGEAARD